MTWSYSGDPSSSDKDQVRFYTGDTDHDDKLVQDEEIDFVLTQHPSPVLAAAVVLRALAAKYSRLADKRVGDIQESLSQKAKAFLELADTLEEQGTILAQPVFGGISVSQKRSLDQDRNAVQPSFRIGSDDHPQTPNERQGYPYFGEDDY